ncbi:unnamed protein product [Calypogeia fissa]
MAGEEGSAAGRRAQFQGVLQQRDEDDSPRLKAQSSVDATDEQEPFMGVKMRRRSSMYRHYKGDYLDVSSNDRIQKLLMKQGDREVLFAENLVKVTRRRKLLRRLLLITDVAVYILETQFYNLKRRISLQSINKVCLSEQSDNFFAIIIPSEYDTLLASTRKNEIVTVLVEASKKLSESGEPMEVQFADKFEYYLDSEHIREVITEQVTGGVKTIFVDT